MTGPYCTDASISIGGGAASIGGGEVLTTTVHVDSTPLTPLVLTAESGESAEALAIRLTDGLDVMTELDASVDGGVVEVKSSDPALVVTNIEVTLV